MDKLRSKLCTKLYKSSIYSSVYSSTKGFARVLPTQSIGYAVNGAHRA